LTLSASTPKVQREAPRCGRESRATMFSTVRRWRAFISFFLLVQAIGFGEGGLVGVAFCLPALGCQKNPTAQPLIHTNRKAVSFGQVHIQPCGNVVERAHGAVDGFGLFFAQDHFCSPFRLTMETV